MFKGFQKNQLEPWNTPDPLPRLRDAARFAYKGDDKPKRAKVKETPSSYTGVQSSSFSTNFGSGTSGLVADPNNKKAKIYQTTASLSPELAKISGTAEKGFGDNLSYLQRNPEERVSWLTEGNDPFYNVQLEQAKRARDEAEGRQLVNAQQGGTTNSTTLGSALGRISSDDLLRRNQILLSALDWGNQNARTDAQLNMGALTGLNSLITPYGSAAASQLQTAKGSQDQAAAATALAQNKAELEYMSEINKYNIAKQQARAQMIGSGLSLAGTLATGGLGGLGSLGSALGGIGSSVGNFFGNAAGGASSLFNGAGAGMGAFFNTSGINGVRGGFGPSTYDVA